MRLFGIEMFKRRRREPFIDAEYSPPVQPATAYLPPATTVTIPKFKKPAVKKYAAKKTAKKMPMKKPGKGPLGRKK